MRLGETWVPSNRIGSSPTTRKLHPPLRKHPIVRNAPAPDFGPMPPKSLRGTPPVGYRWANVGDPRTTACARTSQFHCTPPALFRDVPAAPPSDDQGAPARERPP